MTRSTRWIPGEHLVHCDVCGTIVYSSEARTRWDGFVVCEKDWEMRHPQDFVKVPTENSNKVEPHRPEPTDTFVTVTYTDTGNNTIPSGTFNQEL